MIVPLTPPHFFDPEQLSSVFRVDYEKCAAEAAYYARAHNIKPACQDQEKIGLLLVDVQNTFCVPGFELFVGGASGNGAVDDNKRVCQFIYRHLSKISQIIMTMDSHMAMAIFHAAYLVDDKGQHPTPFSQISVDDIIAGRWQFNKNLAETLTISVDMAQQNLEHYVKSLAKQGKYQLTIWPYHAMLGGIGHAIVSSVEEAAFFHSQVRYSQPIYSMKGLNPHTENYSALGPDVMIDATGKILVPKNKPLVEKLLTFDKLFIAGQAKSHCVAWTIDDLLTEIQQRDPSLADKVYLLNDCTSPIVTPGGEDYSAAANKAFDRFQEAGMHIVQSTDLIPL